MDGQIRSEYGWIREDVEIFESEKKTLRDSKIFGYVWIKSWQS